MKDILLPLRRVHGYLHDVYEKYKKRKIFKKVFKKNQRTVFLVLTPEHGNIGDHGIAWAETSFLAEHGIAYIEITGHQLEIMRSTGELGLLNGFPIVVNGGGYLGTLWKSSEDLLRELIKNSPKSKIMCLPNTIYYEETPEGAKELEKSKRIYNSHKNLVLYAREQRSYELMKRVYNDVKLVPDMVLYLNETKGENRPRRGCLLCLRADQERTRSEEEEYRIFETAKELFGQKVILTDMIHTDPVSPSQRDAVLAQKFDQFRSAELVITDRLHGMVFSAITGTPCIVINSKSPKVRGCYEWIKDLGYIRFADDPSKIVEEYEKIPKGEHHYHNEHLQHYYQELADDIEKKIVGRKRFWL